MKAIYIAEPGGPEVLEVREVDAPVPGHGEVLIDVVAAGLNRADVQQRRGFYPPPPGASEIPGLEAPGRDTRLAPPRGARRLATAPSREVIPGVAPLPALPLSAPTRQRSIRQKFASNIRGRARAAAGILSV